MKRFLPNIVLRVAVVAVVLLALPLSRLSAQTWDSVPLRALGASGASVTTEEGEMFSFTLGQTAFAHFGIGFGVEEGVQQVFCIPVFDTLDTAFCQNDAATRLTAMLPTGYTLPSAVTPTVPGYYEFVIRTLSAGGCDSVVWVHLTIHPTDSTSLTAQTDTFYRWYGDVYAESGTYYHTDHTVYGCDSVLALTLAVMPAGKPLPEIYSMMDVLLMVNHKVGGKDSVAYSYYRWYKDGQIVAEGDTVDTYSENGSKLHGCFYVEVATAADTHYWSSSNEICLGLEGIQKVNASVNLTLAPNPAARGSRVKTVIQLPENELRGARFMVYDAQGRTVYQTTAQPLTYIPTDMAAGVYSVHVILPDGRHAARKLVIR